MWIDDHLRQYDRDLARTVAVYEGVSQRLAQQIPDLALGLSSQDVERRQGDVWLRGGGLQGEEANLWSIAVGDDDLGYDFCKADDGPGGSLDVLALELEVATLAAPNEGVAS
jgi:hypothetical protein